MGFLKRFFRNVIREGSVPVGTSSFERLSEEELEAHLGVARYGDFRLTDAIRPWRQTGYRWLARQTPAAPLRWVEAG